MAVEGVGTPAGDRNGVIVMRPRGLNGYIFTAAGLAGLLGFNVFRGGPFDKRRPNA